jgi:hypothetical protein
MEPEGSLAHSQVPATCLYPEPVQSSPSTSTITYLCTYLWIAWSRVLLEKLTGLPASQEIPNILWNPKVH